MLMNSISSRIEMIPPGVSFNWGSQAASHWFPENMTSPTGWEAFSLTLIDSKGSLDFGTWKKRHVSRYVWAWTDWYPASIFKRFIHYVQNHKSIICSRVCCLWAGPHKNKSTDMESENHLKPSDAKQEKVSPLQSRYGSTMGYRCGFPPHYKPTSGDSSFWNLVEKPW